MVFRPASTFSDPTRGANAQRGFPAPGEGAQRTGNRLLPHSAPVAPKSSVQPKGEPTWEFPTAPQSAQRGLPSPFNPRQRRPKGSMPVKVVQGNEPLEWLGPNYAPVGPGVVQRFGLVTYNPIGAGIQVMNRTAASYYPSTEYENGQIFWTPQQIPTSIPSQGLTSAQDLGAMFGIVDVAALVRVD